MEPGQLYNLQISGGNLEIHNAFLSFSANGTLVIHPSTASHKHTTALLTAGQTLHTLLFPSRLSQSSPKSFYSLQCPSGKGTFQLQISSETEVQGLGSTVLYDNWRIASDDGYVYLRYKGLKIGFWIAVPEESNDGKVWVAWWLSPSQATVEDFEGYAMVDVEVRKVDSEGGSERQKEL
ncbi:hypothetical protein EKO04_009687 [Ascochyta lentis]|uniref:Uncharacterized protein n=1 Tax=Ascochyta lentis TaxID=205686 RepID=A0A8H7IWT7_9PLEO|nr:hypothetical protein EKO04_009687 [Ascochyta lentis]